MSKRIVILGGGLAGATLVKELRKRAFQGEVILVGEEEEIPYDRPPLSKKLLCGKQKPDSIRLLKDGHRYVGRFGVRAEKVKPASREVILSDGEELSYDICVIATGGRARSLELPGADLEGVHYLRTLRDCLNLREALQRCNSVSLVGAGFIGLEVAATAREMGKDVRLFEAGPRPLLPLPEKVAGWFRRVHEEKGVTFEFDCTLVRLEGDRQVSKIVTSEKTYTTELVVVGIGMIPNTQLCDPGDFEIDDGIVVNSSCATGCDEVFAIGDVARYEHPRYGKVRLEHWDNAGKQAEVVARRILGEEAICDGLPFFWTNQYEFGVQVFGHGSPDLECEIRGSLQDDQFAAVSSKDGKPRQAVVVNMQKELPKIMRELNSGD